MGGQTKTPLEAARAAAEKLMAALAPACEQIAIAGSIRRGKAEVGDIELVAMPKIKAPMQQLDLFGNALPVGPQASLLDAALDELLAAKHIVNKPPTGVDTAPAWGEKYKKSWIWLNDVLGWIQVDLFIVRPPAQWGPVFAIRTGPGDWNVALMRYINKRTSWKQDEGHLKHRDTGEVPDLPTEEAYFERLVIPFVAPNERSEQKLYAVVRKMDEM
jgi:DNA polymerase/3'-5' exonuclease PolX